MRRKPDQVDREELIEAAVGVALEHGLHAVTAQAVAARADVTPKVLAAHEPAIDALIATAFRRIASAELAEVKRAVLAHPAPRTQLRALLDTLAAPLRRDIDAVWVESWSLGRRNEQLGASVRSEQSAWHAFVAAVVRRGVRSGDFLEADPEAVAAQLLAVIDGVTAYGLVGYRSEVDRRRLLTTVLAQELGIRCADPEGSAEAAPAR